MATTFAQLVAAARARANMTAAEFDYSLSADDGVALAQLDNVIYLSANPEFHPDCGYDVRDQRHAALRAEMLPHITAAITAAKAKRYVDWSIHSSGPVRYA